MISADHDEPGEPGSGPGAGLARLASAGVRALGHVSLGYGTRPLPDVRSAISAWARLPVAGVFLDHAPAGPFHLGPVVQAVRAARRDGLHTVVLNPGVPADPAYRRLAVVICTFDGPWDAYVDLSLDGVEPGDGHIVFGVPAEREKQALDLAAARSAELVLISSEMCAGLGSSARDSLAVGSSARR